MQPTGCKIISGTVGLSWNGQIREDCIIILMTLDMVNVKSERQRIHNGFYLTDYIPFRRNGFARRIVISSTMKMNAMTKALVITIH